MITYFLKINNLNQVIEPNLNKYRIYEKDIYNEIIFDKILDIDIKNKVLIHDFINAYKYHTLLNCLTYMKVNDDIIICKGDFIVMEYMYLANLQMIKFKFRSTDAIIKVKKIKIEVR